MKVWCPVHHRDKRGEACLTPSQFPPQAVHLAPPPTPRIQPPATRQVLPTELQTHPRERGGPRRSPQCLPTSMSSRMRLLPPGIPRHLPLLSPTPGPSGNIPPFPDHVSSPGCVPPQHTQRLLSPGLLRSKAAVKLAASHLSGPQMPWVCLENKSVP